MSGEPDCSIHPCGLCQERARYAGIFVAVNEAGEAVNPPDTELTKFVCGHCIPTHYPVIDVEADETQVWEVDSDGWLGPIECMDCGDEISVVLEES